MINNRNNALNNVIKIQQQYNNEKDKIITHEIKRFIESLKTLLVVNRT